MKKGQKNKYQKPYFQTDHTGNTDGFWGDNKTKKRKNAINVSKKRKKK